MINWTIIRKSDLEAWQLAAAAREKRACKAELDSGVPE